MADKIIKITIPEEVYNGVFSAYKMLDDAGLLKKSEELNSILCTAVYKGEVIPTDELETADNKDKISLLPMVYTSIDEAFIGGYKKGYAIGFIKGKAETR